MTKDTEEHATESVAAAEATLGTPPADHGKAVRVAASELSIPEECACCGAPPTHKARETHFSGRSVFVPYCAECHAHVSREATRVFATSLSSLIVTFTLAAGLPLVWEPSASLPYVLCVLAGGLFPIGLGMAIPRRSSPGHASAGRALRFRYDGSLSCARPDLADRIAESSGATAFEARFSESRVPRATVVVLVGASAFLPAYYRVHFPLVRVVNLTDDRLEIAVDDKVRASVPPTSAESTGAGVELRVAAGRRTFSARDPTGHLVDTATGTVRSGDQHLYAPASAPYCFWIETTGYGRSRDLGTSIEPLSGPPRFWALPEAIDLWFSPPPEADFDDRSTGGYLRAVRQARCEAAPGSLRRTPEK